MNVCCPGSILAEESKKKNAKSNCMMKDNKMKCGKKEEAMKENNYSFNQITAKLMVWAYLFISSSFCWSMIVPGAGMVNAWRQGKEKKIMYNHYIVCETIKHPLHFVCLHRYTKYTIFDIQCNRIAIRKRTNIVK